ALAPPVRRLAPGPAAAPGDAAAGHARLSAAGPPPPAGIEADGRGTAAPPVLVRDVEASRRASARAPRRSAEPYVSARAAIRRSAGLTVSRRRDAMTRSDPSGDPLMASARPDRRSFLKSGMVAGALLAAPGFARAGARGAND